jgi:adenine-specific DNA-methyltransferase
MQETPQASHIEEALDVLKQLGVPKRQLNERSALLALLILTPPKNWNEITAPLVGIAGMMNFMATHYGKNYAPNTRESVRRYTVHQFIEAGLIIPNPDKPDRPINSGKTVYQIESSALELLKTYGTDVWNEQLKLYQANKDTLQERYSQERKLQRIPVKLKEGLTINLSPGGQNILVEKVITEFAEQFLPGSILVYIGDTDEKFAYFDQSFLTALGLNLDTHGKMPDVIILGLSLS